MSINYINRHAEAEFAKEGNSGIVSYLKDCTLVFPEDRKHFREHFGKKFGKWGLKYSAQSVGERKLSKFQSDACALILGNDGDGFWSATDDTCFKNFSRSALSVQMIARVLDYTVMNQAKSSLCGPISVVMDVARRRPDRYVEYVIDLATRRDGRLGVDENYISGLHVHIRKRSNILKAKHGEDGMNCVDYVAVAGLRNSECFLPYRSMFTSTMLEGATMDSSIEHWLKEAGYQNVKVHPWTLKQSAFAGALDSGLTDLKLHLSRLMTRLQTGWTVVCSMTGADLANITLGRKRDDWFDKTFMGHYVLLRGVKLYTDGASFDMVSWGDQTNDENRPEKMLTWSEIRGTYRGYVCGKTG
jgi:hypothetical protein